MKLRYLLLAAIPTVALADSPMPGNIVLTPLDFDTLQHAIASSQLHFSQPDGSAHPLIDGTQVMQFLEAHRQAPAAPAAAPDAPTPPAHRPLPSERGPIAPLPPH